MFIVYSAAILICQYPMSNLYGGNAAVLLMLQPLFYL